MTLNDMSKTLSDKVAVHLNLPFELETDLQLHSITAQMMVQIVDMTEDAILQEIINYAKENKICDVYLLDKSFVENALKDKIAEKPIGDLYSCPHYRCPSCHRSVVLYEDDPKYPCCQWCGKKLNWNK